MAAILLCRLRNTSRETLDTALVSTVRTNPFYQLASQTCQGRPWSNSTARNAVMCTTQSRHGITTLMVYTLGRAFPTCYLWFIQSSAHHDPHNNSQRGNVWCVGVCVGTCVCVCVCVCVCCHDVTVSSIVVQCMKLLPAYNTDYTTLCCIILCGPLWTFILDWPL